LLNGSIWQLLCRHFLGEAMYFRELAYIFFILVFIGVYFLHIKKNGSDAAKLNRPYFVLSAFICCLLVTFLYFIFFPAHSGGGHVFLFALAAYIVYRVVLNLPSKYGRYAFASIVLGLLFLFMYWSAANLVLFKSLMYPPLCKEPFDMPPFTVGHTDMHKILSIEPVPMRCVDIKTGKIIP